MRDRGVRLVFTAIFSQLATAVSFVILYTLPVLYYFGYQTQVPDLLIGYMAGVLLFSIIGTFLAYNLKKPLMPALVISIAVAAVLMTAYKLSGPVSNTDLLLGALASESFSVIFSTMMQSSPRQGGGKGIAVVSIAIYAILSLVVFIVTAELYIRLGQEYLPNIVVYMELMIAVLASITLLLFARSPDGNRKDH